MTNESGVALPAGVSIKKFSRRRWWLAGLLNVVGIGTGHVYSGRPLRGLTAFLIYFSVTIAMVFWLSLSFSFSVLVIRACIDVGLIILITIDAIRCAKATGPEYETKRYNRWYIYVALVVTVAVSLDVLSVIRSRFFEPFGVPTLSMQPAVLIGDRILVDNALYRASAPKRHDLVQ